MEIVCGYAHQTGEVALVVPMIVCPTAVVVQAIEALIRGLQPDLPGEFNVLQRLTAAICAHRHTSH